MADKRNEVKIDAATRRFDKIKDLVTGVRVSSIVDYAIEAEINGQVQSESLGEYIKNKFEGSRQGKRAFFDRAENRFIIRKEDGTEWTQADLNVAVKKFPLYYADDYRNPALRGTLIMAASLHDVDDAYINHRAFVRIFEEGSDVLRPDEDYKESIQADMLRGNSAFMDETADGIRSSDVEYIIRRPEVSEDKEEQLREEDRDAGRLYDAMENDPIRMRNILILFGVIADESATTRSLRNEVYRKMKNTSNGERGISDQKLFIKYAKMLPEELEFHATIKLATLNHLIIERAGIYEFSGVSVGTTYESVLNYFGRQENDARYEALKVALKK